MTRARWRGAVEGRSSFQLFETAGPNGAVGASLQVRVEAVDVFRDHFAAVEVGHALFRAALQHRLPELVFRETLQALDQRRPDQAFLPRAITALAGERTPGAPALERDLVDFVAVGDLVGRVVGCRLALARRKRGERERDPGDELYVFHAQRSLRDQKG